MNMDTTTTWDLRAARLKLGITLRAAGKLAGASHTTVENWELGHTAITRGDTPNKIRRLCRAYMQAAIPLGYNPADFHETILLPRVFVTVK